MRIEELFPFDKLFPQEWRTKYKQIRLTAYQTRSGIEDFSGGRIITPIVLVLFYVGPLTFDQSIAQPGVEIVDGNPRISFGTTEFGKTSNSRWILLFRPEEPNQSPELEKSLEGLLRFSVHPRLLLAKIFTKVFNLQSLEQSFSSHSLLNPFLMGPETFTKKTILAINNALERIESLPPEEYELVIRALRWLNDAFDDTDKWDSFLKIWIAIEMAFIRKSQAPSLLKKIIIQAYGISEEEANHYFAPGRIYGLRKRIIHNGELPNFNSMLPDMLSDLFRDLLAWRLTGSCPQIALTQMKNNGMTFKKLIENSEQNDST